MARTVNTVVALLIGAAVGAVAVWVTPDPRLESAEQEIADLEEALASARRDANDYERVARVERERREEVSDEVAELRALVAAARDSAGSDARTDAGPEPTPGSGGLPPESWDARKLRNELTRLSLMGRQMFRSPLIDQCAEAARALGESGFGMLLSVLNADEIEERFVRAASMVLEKLNDPRAVKMLRTRWEAATDLEMRRTFLRALANIEGDEQVDVLLGVWEDPSQDDRLRLVAIHGLAVRGHRAALALVTAPAPPGEEGFRARAIASLHILARRAEYAPKELIPAFGTALQTADGEAQIRLALLALEGYWDSSVTASLRGFAADGRRPEGLRERAAKIADAIEAGEPRPARAGVPMNPNLRVEDE